MAQELGSITIAPTEKHTATVFFIHGLGDTGRGWMPVADKFCQDSELAHVKWVLPHSPRRPVTANMSIEMPSWFDIYSFGFKTDEDEDGMLRSVTLIRQLIEEEIGSGINPSRIILGGFSQGGAMSLLTALTSDFQLAGIACLSGWLPLHNKIKSMTSPNALSAPIFWGHGTKDPLVLLDFSKKSVEFLSTEMGMMRGKPGAFGGLSYHLYEGMGHTTNQKELEDLKAFIKTAVPF